ncbi:MAG: hypothetical protein J0L92_29470 [Deltaproteobacteria bacterium]|nr:hypothetical protein [Deltaproteobacteria bacterium]
MRSLVFVVVMLLATIASGASAQSEASEGAAARELYSQGVEAANAGRIEEAIARFERSYALSPRDATLLNLAQLRERAGHVVAAIDSYRRFLARAEPDMLERHGDRARESIASLSPRVARLEVIVFGAQPTDEILLDDAPLARESLGLDLPVDPGAHELTVRRGAATCGTERRQLAEGGRATIELRVFCAAVVSADTTSGPADDRGADPTPFIALGIGGGVVLVGAIILGVVLSQPNEPPPAFVGNVGMGSWVIP